MTDTITLPRVVIERTIKCLSYPGKPDLRLVLRDLFAVLEQQEKQGWVRVPVEPTQLMLRALIKEWDSVGGKTMYENYKAMLKAAPKGSA